MSNFIKRLVLLTVIFKLSSQKYDFYREKQSSEILVNCFKAHNTFPYDKDDANVVYQELESLIFSVFESNKIKSVNSTSLMDFLRRGY